MTETAQEATQEATQEETAQEMSFGKRLGETKAEEPGGGPLPQGDYAVRIVKTEVKTSKSGGKYVKVEFKIANGEYEGRALYNNYNTVVKPNQDRIVALQADGKSLEEATAEVEEKALMAEDIGWRELKKLTTAAGFVDAKDATPEQTKWVEDNVARVLDTDSFELGMIEGATIMMRTKPETNREGKTFQVPKAVWFAHPEKVGDVSSTAAPF